MRDSETQHKSQDEITVFVHALNGAKGLFSKVRLRYGEGTAVRYGQIYLSGKGNYWSKLKKGMLKTKKLLKIIILDSPQYNQQTELKQCKSEVDWGNMYLPSSKVAVRASISENKYR